MKCSNCSNIYPGALELKQDVDNIRHETCERCGNAIDSNTTGAVRKENSCE